MDPAALPKTTGLQVLVALMIVITTSPLVHAACPSHKTLLPCSESTVRVLDNDKQTVNHSCSSRTVTGELTTTTGELTTTTGELTTMITSPITRSSATTTQAETVSAGFQEDINKLAGKVGEVLDRASNLRNELSTITNLTQKRKFAEEIQKHILTVAEKVMLSSLENSDSVNIKEIVGKIVETFEVSGPVVASTLDIGKAQFTQKGTYLTLITNVDLTSSEESLSFNMQSQSFTFNRASLMPFSTDNKQLGLSSVLFDKEDSSKGSRQIMDEWLRLQVADKGGKCVNSPMLMISLDTETTPQLSKNVSVMFELYESMGDSDPACYSLTKKAAYNPDPAGCTTRRINVTHVSCSCNHLTSFAILMSVTEAAEKSSLALDILSYICCSVSIFCLFLSFLTFVSFKGLGSDRNTIHTNLVICLGLGQLLFVVGIDQVSNKTGCAVIAGFLHFLFLASFFWMAMEGLQIYMKLVRIFEPTWSMLPVYFGISYGCPTIIVAITAGMFSQGYGHEKACWLKKEKGFQWSFIGPVIVVIVINTIMLAVALNVMRRHLRSPMNHDLSKLRRMQTVLKGAVSLVCVFGLTWIFGIFNLGGSETEAFAYIFVLLNGSQGVVIFAFHCIGNDKVKKEYRRVLRRATWLPEGCRLCLFKCFTTPSSHEISQATGVSSAKGTLSRFQTSVVTQDTTFQPRKVVLVGRSAQIDDLPEGFKTSVVQVPTVTPSQLADCGIYLGEDDGNVYGADESKLKKEQAAFSELKCQKSDDPQASTETTDSQQGKDLQTLGVIGMLFGSEEDLEDNQSTKCEDVQAASPAMAGL